MINIAMKMATLNDQAIRGYKKSISLKLGYVLTSLFGCRDANTTFFITF